MQHLAHRVQPVRPDGDHIALSPGGRLRQLPFEQPFHIADAVAQKRRLFKLQLPRGFRHLPLQIFEHFVGFTVEEPDHLPDNFRIRLGRNLSRAGRTALADLVMHARAAQLIRIRRLTARPQRKRLPQHFHHLAHSSPANIRPEIFRAVPDHVVHHLRARIRLPLVDADIGIMLIILEENVVIRLVELDKIAFEHQRFEVRLAQNNIEILDFRDHRLNLWRMLLLHEIAAHAVFKIFRFADINNLAPVLHQIAAGAVRQHGNFQAQRVVHAVSPLFMAASPRFFCAALEESRFFAYNDYNTI